MLLRRLSLEAEFGITFESAMEMRDRQPSMSTIISWEEGRRKRLPKRRIPIRESLYEPQEEHPRACVDGLWLDIPVPEDDQESIEAFRRRTRRKKQKEGNFSQISRKCAADLGLLAITSHGAAATSAPSMRFEQLRNSSSSRPSPPPSGWHMDIKPENILVFLPDSTSSLPAIVKSHPDGSASGTTTRSGTTSVVFKMEVSGLLGDDRTATRQYTTDWSRVKWPILRDGSRMKVSSVINGDSSASLSESQSLLSRDPFRPGSKGRNRGGIGATGRSKVEGSITKTISTDWSDGTVAIEAHILSRGATGRDKGAGSLPKTILTDWSGGTEAIEARILSQCRGKF